MLRAIPNIFTLIQLHTVNKRWAIGSMGIAVLIRELGLFSTVFIRLTMGGLSATWLKLTSLRGAYRGSGGCFGACARVGGDYFSVAIPYNPAAEPPLTTQPSSALQYHIVFLIRSLLSRRAPSGSDDGFNATNCHELFQAL